MGRIARLLSFLRVTRNGFLSDVKVNPGGGRNVTGEHCADPGDDSHPLPTDYVITVPIDQTGRVVVVGYLDVNSEKVAEPGEKRIYGRSPGGAVLVDLHLKNDGTAVFTNAGMTYTMSPDGSIRGANENGSFELQAGGDFVVNGATIDTAGNITSPERVTGDEVQTAGGIDLGSHTHGGVEPGAGNTNGPN